MRKIKQNQCIVISSIYEPSEKYSFNTTGNKSIIEGKLFAKFLYKSFGWGVA